MSISVAETIGCDVLVIGRGVAGLRAAEECSARGLGTVVLGADKGNSPFIHGFNVPLAAGDSAECFYQDTRRSGCLQNDKALVRMLCNRAQSAFDFLAELGIAPNRNADGSIQLIRAVGCSYPRVVSVGNEAGAAVMAKLEERLFRRGNTLILRGRALRLCTKDGKICGALAKTKDKTVLIGASAVVCAWGGFAGLFPFTTNSHENGESIGLLSEAGAELVDLEFIQFEPCAAVWPPPVRGKGMITTLFHEGAVLRNGLGKRFCDERSEKDVLAAAIHAEIAAHRQTPHGGVWFDASGVGRKRLEEVYGSYVRRYKDVGIDIASEPFEVAPAPHTTLGGAKIDASCATNVLGLFACGEAAGGIHGANRIGGNAGLETLVFGAVAGESAAKYVLQNQCRQAVSEHLTDAAGGVGADRMLLREKVGDALGVVRSAKGLKDLVDYAEETLLQVGENEEDLLRYRGELTTARLAALSALAREESVGCHRRSDFENRVEKRYRVIAQGKAVRREFTEEI